MTSWRETSSAQAQEDLDTLLDLAVRFAQQQLDEAGEFYPFAVAVDAMGQVEIIAGRPDETDDHPQSADVFASCVAALAERLHTLRAGGLVSDVHLRSLGTDAIEVTVEHVEGQAIRVRLPYAKRRLGRGMRYGRLDAEPASRQIWPQS